MTSKILTRLICSLCLAVSGLSLAPNTADAKDKLVKDLPSEKDFRKALLKVMKSYPADGTHRYYWPRGGKWKGNIADLVYKGKVIAKGDEKGRAFCCGLTFEVFFLAYEKCMKAKKKDFQIGDLDEKGVLKLISAWFGSDGNRRCSQNAIIKYGLGRVITNLKDARPGDFVQFWRHSKSGHSVVFVGWEKDKQGKIVGIRYWSTQKSTKGIGQRMEKIGPKGVKLDEIYIARVGKQ
ncbi:MAG: hypothetical protein P1V97_26080 [Planctomycetota bacterium]|nr:hypothetical protein [Planctomycetota bacterium]